MVLTLHNPANQAHIEDLKDRLSDQLTQGPSDPYGRTWVLTVVATLVDAVQAMDQGVLSQADAENVFRSVRVPGFSFERWLAEMVEEGVYLETAVLRAA